jgi:hypothetical protein
MRITNKNGVIISDINSWEKAFKEVDAEPSHWRVGRSAQALANHFTVPNIVSSNGINVLTHNLLKFGLTNVVMTHAEIEHESRFDKYRGKGRMQDLVIWANNNDFPIVICIEAKVDECFNNDIPNAYELAKKVFEKNPNSKAKQRIEDLCSRYYVGKKIEELGHIRYQLLYYLAGSLTEAKKIEGVVYMPVIVYHTSKFDKIAGETNKKDYIAFMESLLFDRIETDDEVLMYKNNIDGIIIFSSYLEV